MGVANRKECFAFCNYYANHCCVLKGDIDCKKCRFFKVKDEIIPPEEKNRNLTLSRSKFKE